MPTSHVGKPQHPIRALSGFGAGAVAAACGRFAGGSTDAVAVLLRSGQVHVIYSLALNADGKTKFSRDDIAATFSEKQMPVLPIETVAGDFDGDGSPDLLLIGGDGRTLLLRRDKSNTAAGVHFETLTLATPFPTHRQVAAGILADAPDARARLFYLTDAGALFRSAIVFPEHNAAPKLAPGYLALDKIDPAAKMAAGHFRGDTSIDLIVGQMLLPGGSVEQRYRLDSLPTVAEARTDRVWIAADIDGNGKDDLVRACGVDDKKYKNVAVIHFGTNPEREPAPGYFASTNDGIPDAWKLGLIKPGGLDLREMGCQVGHRDLIAEILPMADVPQAKLHQVLENVAAHYAAMPIANPDGSHGVSIHFLFRDPIPVAERDYRKWNDPSDFWATMWPKYVIPSHIGIVHYMGMQNGSAGFGGGYKSWCGNGWPEFIHEMGHQLHLGHEGGDGLQPMSAVYPSLMNYSYSYGINGSSKDIGYSTGPLRALGILNEEHLSETLPLPYETVKFLAGAPYHFHLKPGNDPNTTLVDWNWNGVFGEPDVRADLNYSHGIQMNPQFGLGTTTGSPVVAATGAGGGSSPRLLMFTEPASAPGSSGKRLSVRVWLGSDRDREGRRWSSLTTVADDAVEGDPAAASIGDTTYVVYPTSEGLKLRKITIDSADKLQVSAAIALPSTAHAQPALIPLHDGKRLALFVWRGTTALVSVRIFAAGGGDAEIAAAADRKLLFSSQVPVAATIGASATIAGSGTAESIWVAHMPADATTRAGNHFTVTRLILAGDATMREAETRPVSGNYAAIRPALLWEPDGGLGPEGRLYMVASGAARREGEVGGEVLAMQTAYPQENGGWQVRHYGERSETTTTESAPGACWFQGNMVLAVRQDAVKKETQDAISLSFRGTGATPQPVADFDDIGKITASGLRASLEFVEQL